jgi:hypothetical protein
MIVLVLCLFAAGALAHSGRTDSKGGHYNRSTGEYHYHHGYSAHDHPGGVCPYAVKYTPKPTYRPKSSSKNMTVAKKNSSATKKENGGISLFGIAFGGVFALGGCFKAYHAIDSAVKESRRKKMGRSSEHRW